MNMRYLTWLALAAALASAGTAQAAIYKYVDEDGNVTYSETPPPKGDDYEYIRKPKTPSGTAAKPATPGKSSAAEIIQKGAEEREKSEAIDAELAKAKDTRRKNCEAAKKNLQAYTTFRRFQNDDGSVDRMDDNERMRKIEESKQQIREFCD